MSLTAVAGALVGFAITLLGGGGSLLLVPALVYLMHEPVESAAGTALIAICASATVGAIGHWRAGRVRMKTVGGFGVASMIGAAVGAKLHGLISERATMLLFAVILFAAAGRMIFGSEDKEGRARLPVPVMLVFGVIVGVVAGFMGVGGGFLIVPVLVAGARLPMREAIGTSVGVVALSAASGATTHMIAGAVSPALAGVVAVGAMFGAAAAVPLSGKLSARALRYGFAALVTSVAVYILFRELT